MSEVRIVEGDLLDVVDVDAVVNPWNRNVVPRWMLLPRGVSAAIKRRAGAEPFVSSDVSDPSHWDKP